MKRFEPLYQGEFEQRVYDELIYISTTALNFIKKCNSLNEEWDYMQHNNFKLHDSWTTKDRKYKVTMWKYQQLTNTYVVTKRDNKTDELVDCTIDSQYNIFYDFGDLVKDDPLTVDELVTWIADSGYDNIFDAPKWTAHIFGRKCVPLYQEGELVGHIPFEITRPDWANKKEAQVSVTNIIQGGPLPECRKSR